ncbi:hypothetical protein ABSA28_00535 [Candidatus Hepatincolaceae symbiont of Richtersius coronifer]
MKRVQSKKYGKRTSKTFVAELYFTSYPDKTNEEIANILSEDVSKTSLNQVEVMRSRWKNKLQRLITKHPELNRQVRKIITSADFQQSFLGACVAVSGQVEERQTKFSNKEVIDLFSNVTSIVNGGSHV